MPNLLDFYDPSEQVSNVAGKGPFLGPPQVDIRPTNDVVRTNKGDMLAPFMPVDLQVPKPLNVPMQYDPSVAQPVRNFGVNDFMTNQIKQFEGYRKDAYIDSYAPNGDPIHSQGYGTRSYPGAPPMTEEMAHANLLNDLAPVHTYLQNNVKVPMTQSQYGALVSFGHNVGMGGLQKLMPQINAGDFSGAADHMRYYIHAHDANGQMTDSPGLIQRRAQEAAMFNGTNTGYDSFGDALKGIKSTIDGHIKSNQMQQQQQQMQQGQQQGLNNILNNPRAMMALSMLSQNRQLQNTTPAMGGAPNNMLPMVMMMMANRSK